MGSSGSGKLTDYPGPSKGGTGGKGGTKGGGQVSGGGSGGGGSPGDRCAQTVQATLEDVEHSEYFSGHGVVPPSGTKLRVSRKKRIVAETDQGETVGNLPTAFNYLASCLAEGWTYEGFVRSSANPPPVANVAVELVPLPPA